MITRPKRWLIGRLRLALNPILAAILRDAAVLTLGAAAGKTMLLVFRYIALRAMSMTEYGEFALIVSWFRILLPVATFHTGHALAVAFGQGSGRKEPRAWLGACLILVAVTSAIVSPLGAFYAGHVFQRLTLPLLLLFFVGFFSTGLIVIAQGVFRGRFSPWAVSSLESLAGLGKVIVTVAVVLGLAVVSTSAVLSGFLLGPALSAVVGLILVWKLGLFAEGPSLLRIGFSYLPRLLRFSGLIVLGDIIVYTMQFVSRWVLQQDGLEAVAVWDATLVAYSVMQMAFVGVGLAVVPHASKADHSAGQRFQLPFWEYMLLYLPIGATIALMILTPWARQLLAMLKLEAYVYILPVLAVRLVGAPLDLVYVTATGVLFGRRQTGDYLLISAVSAPLQVGAYFLSARIYGVMGVACAAVGFSLVKALLAKWRVSRKTNRATSG